MPQPPDERSDLDRLEARLSEVRRQSKERQGPSRKPWDSRGIGAGFRIATELLAGVVFGVVAGLLLDDWLGLSPLFLILLFFLGAAAGLMNVIRAAKQIEAERKRLKAEEEAKRS